MERNKFIYVCPNCFEIAEKCRCINRRDYEIEIDKNIYYAIKKLNDAGYFTRYCCESHFEHSFKIYIMFCDNYNFERLPTGFKYRKTGRMLEHVMKSKKENDFEEEKIEYIGYLNSWVDELTKAH